MSALLCAGGVTIAMRGERRTAAELQGQGMYSGCGPKQSIRPANTGRKAGPRGAAPRLPACSGAPCGLCCARAHRPLRQGV